nr:DDE-type integrase/transposase/recombinase [Bacillus cereus]
MPTQKGALYLAVFVDMYSRKVIDWPISARMKKPLMIDHFLQRYYKEHPKIGLIIHTDQVAQYTSSNYQVTLKKYSTISSVSKKEHPYDTALMESFYKTIKREFIQDAKFLKIEHARAQTLEYIDFYYNIK